MRRSSIALAVAAAGCAIALGVVLATAHPAVRVSPTPTASTPATPAPAGVSQQDWDNCLADHTPTAPGHSRSYNRAFGEAYCEGTLGGRPEGINKDPAPTPEAAAPAPAPAAAPQPAPAQPAAAPPTEGINKDSAPAVVAPAAPPALDWTPDASPPEPDRLPLCAVEDSDACYYPGRAMGDKCDWVNSPGLVTTWFFNCIDPTQNGVVTS